MKLVIPLHLLYWSNHIKDESKCGFGFAFIFGVNWLWLTAPIIFGKIHFLLISENEFTHEIKCYGMTSFMDFICKFIRISLHRLFRNYWFFVELVGFFMVGETGVKKKWRESHGALWHFKCLLVFARTQISEDFFVDSRRILLLCAIDESVLVTLSREKRGVFAKRRLSDACVVYKRQPIERVVWSVWEHTVITLKVVLSC